jgi:hypothetical protein
MEELLEISKKIDKLQKRKVFLTNRISESYERSSSTTQNRGMIKDENEMENIMRANDELSRDTTIMK